MTATASVIVYSGSKIFIWWRSERKREMSGRKSSGGGRHLPTKSRSKILPLLLCTRL